MLCILIIASAVVSIASADVTSADVVAATYALNNHDWTVGKVGDEFWKCHADHGCYALATDDRTKFVKKDTTETLAPAPEITLSDGIVYTHDNGTNFVSTDGMEENFHPFDCACGSEEAPVGATSLSSAIDNIDVPPSAAPTSTPTNDPTSTPTVVPTDAPTGAPTDSPTVDPTDAPTAAPTNAPTVDPTDSPTVSPTGHPTHECTTTSDCSFDRYCSNNVCVKSAFYDFPSCKTDGAGCVMSGGNQKPGQIYYLSGTCYKAVTSCQGCLEGTTPGQEPYGGALPIVDCPGAGSGPMAEFPSCSPGCLASGTHQRNGWTYRIGGTCYLAKTGCWGCLEQVSPPQPYHHTGHLEIVPCFWS